MTRNDETPSLSTEALAEALDGARRRADTLESQLGAVATELESARQEVGLLSKLLALREGGDSEMPEAPAADEPGDTPKTRGGQDAHPVVLEAMRELAAAGHALHISELMDRLQARNVAIPGAGAQANLIAHLTRSEGVVRPKRGMYALATWDIPTEPPLTRATRRRVRGPSKERKQQSR